LSSNGSVRLAAFEASAAEAVEVVVEGDPVAVAIGAFIIERRAWSGTAAQLLHELTTQDRAEARPTEWTTWPRNPTALSIRFAGICGEPAQDRRRGRGRQSDRSRPNADHRLAQDRAGGEPATATIAPAPGSQWCGRVGRQPCGREGDPVPRRLSVGKNERDGAREREFAVCCPACPTCPHCPPARRSVVQSTQPYCMAVRSE
jgi:hypothetical protein